MKHMYDNYFENIGLYLSQLQRLTQEFGSWGYSPTIIPMLDEYESYESVESALSKDSFRILNSEGNLMLLRSDTTLFLARAIGTHLAEKQLPLRVYYSNSVIGAGAAREETERLQIGIELIGTDSRAENSAEDFEVICVLASSLKHLNVPNFRVHVGSRRIVDALIASRGGEKKSAAKTAKSSSNNAPKSAPAGASSAAYRALFERDEASLARIFGAADAAALLSMSPAGACRAQLEKLASRLPAARKAEVREFHALLEGLEKTLGKDTVVCDLSETGTHDYYNGVVFSFYMEKRAAAIAQGGRYDALLQKFNGSIAAGAVGGTIFPHLFFEDLIRSASRAERAAASQASPFAPQSAGAARGHFIDKSIDELVARARKYISEKK